MQKEKVFYFKKNKIILRKYRKEASWPISFQYKTTVSNGYLL